MTRHMQCDCGECEQQGMQCVCGVLMCECERQDTCSVYVMC